MEIKNINTCNAKTRRGTSCQRAPMRNGRCSNHGGKSLIWFAHPNYKHGRYSKYSGIPQMEKDERKRKNSIKKRLKELDKVLEQIRKRKGREPNSTEILQVIKAKP